MRLQVGQRDYVPMSRQAIKRELRNAIKRELQSSRADTYHHNAHNENNAGSVPWPFGAVEVVGVAGWNWLIHAHIIWR